MILALLWSMIIRFVQFPAVIIPPHLMLMTVGLMFFVFDIAGPHITEKLKGLIAKSTSIFTWGILFLFLSLLWSTLISFGRVSSLLPLTEKVGIHHLLMLIGMVFLAMAARRLFTSTLELKTQNHL